MRYSFFTVFLFLFLNSVFSQAIYPGKIIGPAEVKVNNNTFEIENNCLTANWNLVDRVIHFQKISNKETGQKIDFKSSPFFYLELENGELLTSNDFKCLNNPVVIPIKGLKTKVKKVDQFQGKSINAELLNEKSGLKIFWEVSIKDGSNYFTQKFTLSPKDSIRIKKIVLIETPKTAGMNINGIVAGSPVSGNNFFCALEHPMSQADTIGLTVKLFIKRYEKITKSASLVLSTVWGVSPKNQLRRSYLYYLERERAVPYHQQLHYNSWFDISWIDRKLDEASCLDRIHTFGDSLIQKRKIHMNAFLFDDGWDNNQTLWQFNAGFPNGFKNLSKIAKEYGTGLGVWISPWGGYDEAKKQRLIYGKKQIPPFETNDNGFTLSGSNYYKRFVDVVSNFVKDQGVSMFKFDGVGMGNNTEGANASYEKDINALLKLIPNLREIKPDLYFSLTVGTWPSPYWLFYGDAIWRNGEDTGLAGVGSKRQQWITFRDAETYNNIVKRGALYPLNSLMYHGICISDNGTPGTLEMSDKSIEDEIWSFFATGTSLQEMYINPHKLNKANWDCLAKAILWAKKNENIMVDTHWIGGSPSDLQVYGFASWSPKKAILSLRNPSSEKQIFNVNVNDVFDLPEKTGNEYKFFDVRAENSSRTAFQGSSYKIIMEPFEVKVYEAYPIK